MEAARAEELPGGPGWQYEPKWDGFRCLAFRDGDQVQLQSKAGQSLTRYFPEVVGMLRRVKWKRFVIDGEIVVPVNGRLSFDDLLMRIHPAESRVRKLANDTPAAFVMFDLLVDQRGKALIDLPLQERRQRLERFAGGPKAGLLRNGAAADSALVLSPATSQRSMAERWLRSAGGALDG